MAPQREVAATFRRLHAPGPDGRPFVLPNAWDLPSALAFAAAGFPAVATSSFAVAITSGRPDGRRASRDGTLSLVLDLLATPGGLGVPLSVDVEDGFADSPAEVAAYVSLLQVAGVNLEDSTAETLVDVDRHAAKVAAVKHRTPTTFVNARVDTFWLGQDATLEATLARARSYVAAGADGIFVPGVEDLDLLREVCAAVDVPVNVLPVPGASLADLAAVGVRRVSTGSATYRAAHHAALATALAVRDDTSLPELSSYGEVQSTMVARS